MVEECLFTCLTHMSNYVKVFDLNKYIGLGLGLFSRPGREDSGEIQRKANDNGRVGVSIGDGT